jgi:hypothetical protein
VNACIETRRSHSGFQGLMKPGAFISSYGLDCIQLHSTAFNCIQLHSTCLYSPPTISRSLARGFAPLVVPRVAPSRG